jgi:hypothetical protein
MFTAAVDTMFAGSGIEVVRAPSGTAVNAYSKRWGAYLRTECCDWVRGPVGQRLSRGRNSVRVFPT